MPGIGTTDGDAARQGAPPPGEELQERGLWARERVGQAQARVGKKHLSPKMNTQQAFRSQPIQRHRQFSRLGYLAGSVCSGKNHSAAVGDCKRNILQNRRCRGNLTFRQASTGPVILKYA